MNNPIFLDYKALDKSLINKNIDTSLIEPTTPLQDTSTSSTVADDSTDTVQGFWGFKSSGSADNPYITQESSTTSQQDVSGSANGAVRFALSKVGSAYEWGKSGENGKFDCSGLIQAAFKSQGKNVPRSTEGWLHSNKQTVGKYDGQPGDVIITSSNNSKSGRHARLITKNLGNGKYECVEAKGKKYGVITSTYTVGNDLKNIYRAKQGLKLIKKNGHI